MKTMKQHRYGKRDDLSGIEKAKHQQARTMSILETIPDTVDTEAAQSAKKVLNEAPDHRTNIALVSGGHDSLTALDLVHRSSQVPVDKIVHINTGIGIPETRKFVEKRADDLNIPFLEVGKPEENGDGQEYRNQNEQYEQMVKNEGFPGPPVHKIMYRNLKEKPLRKFLNTQDGPIALISGVRKNESDRRMENVDEDGVGEFLGYPTISPLVDFTGLDVRRYRTGLDLPDNPVSNKLEMSGECLCGAFANRGELRMIRLFYPAMYRYLLCLEAKVTACAATENGPNNIYSNWGHGRLKDHEQEAMQDSNQMLLCNSCDEQRCD